MKHVNGKRVVNLEFANRAQSQAARPRTPVYTDVEMRTLMAARGAESFEDPDTVVKKWLLTDPRAKQRAFHRGVAFGFGLGMFLAMSIVIMVS